MPTDLHLGPCDSTLFSVCHWLVSIYGINDISSYVLQNTNMVFSLRLWATENEIHKTRKQRCMPFLIIGGTLRSPFTPRTGIRFVCTLEYFVIGIAWLPVRRSTTVFAWHNILIVWVHFEDIHWIFVSCGLIRIFLSSRLLKLPLSRLVFPDAPRSRLCSLVVWD
jgi:hypothetical protein